MLAAAPDFTDHDPYTGRGAEGPGAVLAPAAQRRRRPAGPGRAAWRYPPGCTGTSRRTCSPGRIAKYFSNAIREDTILRLARGGIVFAPGRAGTVQEVFQAATKTFYGTDGASGPYVFLDRAFWTADAAGGDAAAPAAGRVARSATCRRPIHVTDDVRRGGHAC